MRNPALPLKKTALSAAAAVALMCALAPTPARADDEVIHYMDKDGNTCEIAKSEVIELGNKAVLEDGKTYFVPKGEEEIVGPYYSTLKVKGSATLILGRGVRIESYAGIHCPKGKSLTITGQLDNPELPSGRFEAVSQAFDDKAFIGGHNDEDAGEIAICGCYVSARGGVNGAGIGGGKAGDGGKVIIRNAEVSAMGGDNGAGIGGGGSSFIDDAGDGGEVLIVDSKVTAEVFSDHSNGAGIGGGADVWTDIGDQGDGGNVTIKGNSVVDAKGRTASAIGRGDDEGKVGTVTLDDSLKVTDLSRNKGRVATAAEREGYCYYREHVKIEPCGHEDATYDTSPSAHKGMCPHCYGIPEVVLFHEFGEDGNCKTCGYHADRPFFVAPEMGEGDQDYVVFWLDINGMDEATFEASYIDIEVWDEGTDARTRRDKLSQWGERRGDLRSYATWVLDDVSDDALVIATVHYGKNLTVCQSASLGELRAAAQRAAAEAQ